MYLALKNLHMMTAAASFGLFLVRGVWMMADSPRLRSRFARVVPHVVDTVLLASAIGLALIIRQYPFMAPWLTAKLLAVLLYIVLGSIALKRGRTRAVRVAAFIAALAVFGWIVQTARLHAIWLPAI